jgi:serine/threonine-protein kinase
MGVVWLAEDMTLGREVALKVLGRSFAAELNFEERFRREARVIASLEHPNIVPIHSLERIGDVTVIDMAYIKGGALADAEQRSVVTIYETVHYIVEVLDALACCHSSGIIHRDIKPNNILLTPEGRALLSDFGLAGILAEYRGLAVTNRSSSGFFMGTPRYAPPEAWDGNEPTPAWDVYSVGMVLYEAVAPSLPYDAATPLALVKQMAERPIPPLKEVAPYVSKELSDLVEAMLEHNPVGRLSDAGAALERLVAVPEYGVDFSARISTIVHRRSRLLSAKSRRPLNPGTHSRRTYQISAAVLLVAVLGLAIGLGAVGVLSPHRNGPAQERVTENGDGFRVFDTVDQSTQSVWPGHWSMRPGPNSGEWTAVAFETSHLWFMQAVTPSANSVAFEGQWAEYGDSAASLFRQGTLSGSGRWVKPDETLAVTLEFRDEQEGSRETRSFVLRSATGHESGPEFTARLETNAYAQSLLFNELVPRATPWALSCEKLLWPGPSRRTVVPFLDAGMPVRLDGRLDEDAWRAAVGEEEGEPGVLKGVASGREARMLVRYNLQGMYFGLHVPGHFIDPRISISVLNRFCIPVAESSVWSVAFCKDVVLSGRYMKRKKQLPWTCDWKAASTNGDYACECEVFVPFFGDRAGGFPAPGERWRVCCALSESRDEGTKPVASWGYGAGQDGAANLPECGALLVFGIQNALDGSPPARQEEHPNGPATTR